MATDGDDGAAGTEGAPLATIQAGLNAALAGDAVYVKPGTYEAAGLSFPRTGTAEAIIQLTCAPGALGQVRVRTTPTWVAANPGGAVITASGARYYLRINGLVIEGPRGRPEAPVDETFGANGVTFSNGAGLGCFVTNCVIRKNVHCGVKELDHGGTGITVAANVIYDNGTDRQDHGIYMPASNSTLDGNLIFRHPGYALHLRPAPANLIVRRNVCWQNSEGSIVQHGANGVITHNTGVGGQHNLFYFRGGCTGNTVTNNIFANADYRNGDWDKGGEALNDPPTNNTDNGNQYYPQTVAPEITCGAADAYTDPRFRDPVACDYRLAAGSPCLGSAIDGCDRGAYVPDESF